MTKSIRVASWLKKGTIKDRFVNARSLEVLMFLKDTFYHLKTLGGLVPGTGSVPRIGASNAGSVLGFAAAVLIENAVEAPILGTEPVPGTNPHLVS